MLRMDCVANWMRCLFSVRYYMIERAKDAKIVGIVVGTLGVGMKLYKVFCTFLRCHGN